MMGDVVDDDDTRRFMCVLFDDSRRCVMLVCLSSIDSNSTYIVHITSHQIDEGIHAMTMYIRPCTTVNVDPVNTVREGLFAGASDRLTGPRWR